MRNLLCLRKSIGEVKPDGEISIGLPMVGRCGNEISIGVHFDEWRILTKGWGKSEIGILWFIREKVNGGA